MKTIPIAEKIRMAEIAKRQSDFDRVVLHSRTMNGKSINSRGITAYRGLNNSKCFTGILIPDDIYDPAMENMLVNNLSRDFPACLLLFDIGHMAMYVKLQIIHDTTDPRHWQRELKQLAKDYLLHYPTQEDHYDH